MIPKNSALVVVDLQNDFLPPQGSLAVPDGDSIIDPITRLLDTSEFATIIATRDYHPKGHCSFASCWCQDAYTSREFSNPKNPEETKTQILWPDHCVQGTFGCELHKTFKDKFNSLVASNPEKFHEVRKGYLHDREYYSAFEDTWGIHHTELKDILNAKKIETIYLVGLAYDFCVLNTGISSSKSGFKTFVLKDLCKSVYVDKINETDSTYKENGIEIIKSKDILI